MPFVYFLFHQTNIFILYSKSNHNTSKFKSGLQMEEREKYKYQKWPEEMFSQRQISELISKISSMKVKMRKSLSSTIILYKFININLSQINKRDRMSQQQQYELKLAVRHHPSLKTEQLIQFLQNESNQFLANDLPTSLTTDSFLTIFEQVADESIDNSEFVGMIILYSSASVDSFQWAKRMIPEDPSLSDMFLIFVEMDNTEKKTNAIGDEGEKICERNNYQFVRLTLYNSEDLLNCLNKNLYELIENYYYPNQEERQQKNYDSQYVFHYSKSQPNVMAIKEQRKSIQNLLDKAEELRQSRQQEITQEQLEIDESIKNVEKAHKIKEKFRMVHITKTYSLFSTGERLDEFRQKYPCIEVVKLTQVFLDEDEGKKKPSRYNSENRMMASRMSQSGIYSKFMNKHRKLEPLMKIVLAVVDSVVVEVDVYENSTYDDLALIGIRKLGISSTEHNINVMRDIIKKRIEDFVKQLSRGVKNSEKQRIYDRSFLNRSNLNN